MNKKYFETNVNSLYTSVVSGFCMSVFVFLYCYCIILGISPITLIIFITFFVAYYSFSSASVPFIDIEESECIQCETHKRNMKSKDKKLRKIKNRIDVLEKTIKQLQNNNKLKDEITQTDVAPSSIEKPLSEDLIDEVDSFIVEDDFNKIDSKLI